MMRPVPSQIALLLCFFFVVVKKDDSYAADIVLVLDSSQTVGKRNFKTEKDFVKSLAHRLNVEPGKSRVAIVNYGNIALTTVTFDDFKDVLEFERLLDAVPLIGGKTMSSHTNHCFGSVFVFHRLLRLFDSVEPERMFFSKVRDKCCLYRVLCCA